MESKYEIIKPLPKSGYCLVNDEQSLTIQAQLGYEWANRAHLWVPEAGVTKGDYYLIWTYTCTANTDFLDYKINEILLEDYFKFTYKNRGMNLKNKYGI